MYKKLSYLLVSCILLSGSLSASGLFAPSTFDSEESTKFTITYKIFKPSRVFGVNTSDPQAQVGANKYDNGFGFAVNFLNFEYSSMYDNGERFIGYFTFANNSPVNPYIGISYIRNTKLYDIATKSKVDGADGLLGIQLSYFKYVNPYFEYMPISSLWMFGVRFQLHLIVDKKDAVLPKPNVTNKDGVVPVEGEVSASTVSSSDKAN